MKNQYIGGNCLKRGAWTVGRFKGGHGKKEGLFLRGGLIPQCTLCYLSLGMNFEAILSNIDKVLPINPSANVFVLGDFSVHHNDWQAYSSGIDRLVNSFIIFLKFFKTLK